MFFCLKFCLKIYSYRTEEYHAFIELMSFARMDGVNANYYVSEKTNLETFCRSMILTLFHHDYTVDRYCQCL